MYLVDPVRRLVFSCSVVRICLKTQWLSTRQATFLGPFGTIGASRALNHFVRSDSETGLSSYFFRSIEHSSLPLRIRIPNGGLFVSVDQIPSKISGSYEPKVGVPVIICDASEL